jgi:N-acetylmuramate 1-kinase
VNNGGEVFGKGGAPREPLTSRAADRRPAPARKAGWFVESIIHELQRHASRPVDATGALASRLQPWKQTPDPPTKATPVHPLTATHAAPGIVWADSLREQAFARWFEPVTLRHGLLAPSLRAASSDASFRRYFRLDSGSGTPYIVMDAPPPQEDVRPFVDIASRLARAGLNAPRIVEQDAANGFLLLSDLGTRLYLDDLLAAQAAGDSATITSLMRDAIAALVQWQRHGSVGGLPLYDDALLRRELALFPEWCVQREFAVTWSDAQQRTWRSVCDTLVASALAQPQVAVHRDFMPRNLMVCTPNPGILDFQDAVCGPASYDPACFLRDAFISWDEALELDWAVRYWEAARKAGVLLPDDFGEFWRQLEWMGLQRHLKVLGIFCRLKHRDGKPSYSQDLPRFFSYAHKVATRYAPLRPLTGLLEPLMGVQRQEAFY